MRIEWLYEAQMEFRELLNYYRNEVGIQSAGRFSDRILNAVGNLESFPEMGVLKEELLLGQYGFRALFIDKYVCIYRVDEEVVRIYHIADARSNYMYRIFGIEP